jgi:hypothetical protein
MLAWLHGPCSVAVILLTMTLGNCRQVPTTLLLVDLQGDTVCWRGSPIDSNETRLFSAAMTVLIA